MPARQSATGTILVEVPAAGGGAAGVVVYARVSSHDQRADLDRQGARVTGWVTGQGLPVAGVVCEVGSGVSGKRPKLRRILSGPSARVIVVEHRGRLARFGVEHLDAALAASGRRLIVAGPGEATGDLVRDMIEVLTSMCARLYGRDVNAAINLARLSEHALSVEGRPAGSGPVAGRRAIHKTSPPSGAVAGGEEASTPHSGPPAADQTGTAPPQGAAA